jgi:PAS domain S-box-containing protein
MRVAVVSELPVVSRSTVLGRALCLTGAILGALGILAWLLGLGRALSVFPGLPPMMPNSGFALLLLGGAGVFVLRQRHPRWERWLVMAAIALVLIVSLGTVAEYALDTHLFLDQLVPDRGGPYYLSPSSPPSAIAFALLAAGVLLFDSGSGDRFRPSEWLILGAALIAITALLGYLYGASSAYRITGTAPADVAQTSLRVIRVAGDLLIIGVSFSSAAGLLLISTGLVLGRSDWRTMRILAGPGPGGLLLRRLIPVAILVPIGFGVIASRLPGTGDSPVALAGMTDMSSMVSLFLLVLTARRIDHGHDAVEHERKRTHDLINLASDGIYIADLDGRLTDVNEAGCRLHGASLEEMLTKSIRDLIPPEDNDRLSGHRRHLLDGHTDVDEWMAVRKDGSRFPVEVSAKILPDGRWQAIVRDISERKRTEEALRLSEATARQATKARDEMLGIVAHDLRNPLQVIVANAQALRRAQSVENARVAGQEIEAASRRMNHLIQDLLDVTRLDAGQFTMRPAPIPVRELIEDTADVQRVLASSADVAIKTDISPDLPDLWIDRDRILQVFENLIGNAIKFTPPGGTITLGATEAGADSVEFSVSDTGSGIAEQDLPHVFERFWQPANTKGRGAGLGLAIVKGIVEAHGGRVWAAGLRGRGSTFHFTLPSVAGRSERAHAPAIR